MDEQLAGLAARFRYFAAQETQGTTPLYERLAVNIAGDPLVLAIATHARPEQPLPHLFFAVVHYLLLKQPGAELARYYPDLNAAPASDDPYPAFQAFCLEHRAEIEEVIATRRVQTNEVSRCACTLPAFGLVAERTGQPLWLIEVGTSAGFNLLWDQYGYDYGNGLRWGDLTSPLQLNCELRGKQPSLPVKIPSVYNRIGLDLNPLDVNDPDTVLWLRALIWPELRERVLLLQQAISMTQMMQPTLIAGDALATLPGVLHGAPTDVALVVYHSSTLNQFPTSSQAHFRTILEEIALKRDLYHISLEWEQNNYELTLTSYHHDKQEREVLAYCNAHGKWLEWLLPFSARQCAAARVSSRVVNDVVDVIALDGVRHCLHPQEVEKSDGIGVVLMRIGDNTR